MSMDGHTFGFLIQLMTCSFSILRLDTSMPPLLCAHSQRMVGRQCPFDQQWTQLVVVSNVERIKSTNMQDFNQRSSEYHSDVLTTKSLGHSRGVAHKLQRPHLNFNIPSCSQFLLIPVLHLLIWLTLPCVLSTEQLIQPQCYLSNLWGCHTHKHCMVPAETGVTVSDCHDHASKLLATLTKKKKNWGLASFSVSSSRVGSQISAVPV